MFGRFRGKDPAYQVNVMPLNINEILTHFAAAVYMQIQLNKYFYDLQYNTYNWLHASR